MVQTQELNHLIWFFSLTKKEREILNNLPNNIKGGLEWAALRSTEKSAVIESKPASPVAKVKGKRGRPKGIKIAKVAKVAKAPKVSKKKAKTAADVKIVNAVEIIPAKRGRGRPKKA